MFALRHPFRLPLAFLASGAAALLFQVLWFRALGRVLGNTVWAGAMVLTAFMLGMALGGLLVARWSQRIRRPALAFALAETTVGLSGVLLVYGLPAMEPLIGQWLSPLAGYPTAQAGVRLSIALAAMLVPTIAMGTTLALGVRMLADQETARALGTLYAANTFGACLAPLVAEYGLIGTVGLQGTALVAAGLNICAAALAITHPTRISAGAPMQPRGLWMPSRLLVAAALAGGLALALEVVWFRLLILFAPASDTTFALMLTLVLLGIGIGGALAPRVSRSHIAWIAVGGGLAVVAGYALTGSPLAGARPDLIFHAIPLMLPAAIFSGLLFTLLGAALRADSSNPQPAIGALTTANTLGAAAGATFAALVLLPNLGIESSLFALAAGYGLLPLLLVKPTGLLLPLGAAAIGLMLFPFGRIALHLHAAALPYERLDDAKVVRVFEGPTTTLQLLRHDRFGAALRWRLLTDSYSMTAIDHRATRYMQMFAWLPLALHPAPMRALLISYGAGNTADALLSEPLLTSLTVVDVAPEMFAASAVIHGARDPLKDRRVRLVLEDGRHFLRSRGEQFDIITAEPPPPAIAGVVNLYTREYFIAVAERLAPGGLATYWLPAPQFRLEGALAVTRAFCDAFPDCTLWAGGQEDWILMGGREFRHRPSAQHFSRLWRDAAAARRIAAGGLEHPTQLGAAFLADAGQLRQWTAQAAPLTDNFPKRIAPQSATGAHPPEYAAWLAGEGASRRFGESPWVARHWPPEFIHSSLPYFAVQPLLNGGTTRDFRQRLTQVDEVLRNSDLRIPVLWLLGSDVVEQEIVNRRLAAGGYQPGFAYPLGVRALAERDFAKAADLFSQAAAGGSVQARALAAYSLCRAGSREMAAAQRAEELPAALRCWDTHRPE